MPTKPLAVSVAGFCEMLSIKRTKAHALIRDRAVDSVRIGGKRLIKVSSIEKLLETSNGEVA
jgi:excisionase family DNA binding protein